METDCLVHVFRRLDLDDLASAAPRRRRPVPVARARPAPGPRRAVHAVGRARRRPRAPPRRVPVRVRGVPQALRVARGRVRRRRRAPAAPRAGLRARARLPPVPAAAAARALPGLPAADEACLPELVTRWPLLEHLELDAKPCSVFPALAARLAQHCPNFTSLKTSGAVNPEDADVLARSLPRLRSLCLDRSYLPRQELLAILAGSRELREFSARGCVGFDENDEEVRKRAAGIWRFEVAGSRMVDDLEDESCDSSYVDVM